MSRSGVVVFGEALLDVFAGEEVIGGAPFNVARNLAALGTPPLMVTRIGADARGERIVEAMRVLGMPGQGVQRDAARPTGVVQVALSDGQPTFAIATDSAWDHLDAADVARVTVAAQPRLACFGTLAQRHPDSRSAIHAGLATTDALRVLDLNLRGQAGERERAAESLLLADVLKVNDDELAQLHAWFGVDVNPTEAGGVPGDPRVPALLRRFDLQRIVVTRGAQGWSSVSRHGEVLEGGAARVRVVDTVGAGDAFTAVLLLGELQHWPPAATLARAAEFAAATCTLRGAFAADSPIYAQARKAWLSPGG